MKKFELRKVKVPFSYCTLTIDQMAKEPDILIDVYGVDPIAAFNLGFAERHLLLKALRKATKGKLERDF